MKNKKGVLLIGILLLLSSFMALYNYSKKGCITYFQGITQCGDSALLGILIILLISIFLISMGIRKRN